MPLRDEIAWHCLPSEGVGIKDGLTHHQPTSVRRLIRHLKVSRDTWLCWGSLLVGVAGWSNHLNITGFWNHSVMVHWSPNQEHQRSTSAGCHLLCVCYMHSSKQNTACHQLKLLRGWVARHGVYPGRRHLLEALQWVCGESKTVEHYLMTNRAASTCPVVNNRSRQNGHSVPDLYSLECFRCGRKGSQCQKSFKPLLHQLGIFTQDSQRVGEEKFHQTTTCQAIAATCTIWAFKLQRLMQSTCNWIKYRSNSVLFCLTLSLWPMLPLH